MHENAELLTLLSSSLSPLLLSLSLLAPPPPVRVCWFFPSLPSLTMSPFLFRNTSLARTRPILSRSFVLRPDLSLTDSTPPFNLHINPTRRNWRVFKRADLEFFRRCDAVPRSIAIIVRSTLWNPFPDINDRQTGRKIGSNSILSIFNRNR